MGVGLTLRLELIVNTTGRDKDKDRDTGRAMDTDTDEHNHKHDHNHESNVEELSTEEAKSILKLTLALGLLGGAEDTKEPGRTAPAYPDQAKDCGYRYC